jgi:hypothetical protein
MGNTVLVFASSLILGAAVFKPICSLPYAPL